MGAYILRRLLLVIPTLLGIMLINFALTQFVPGGPMEQRLAEMAGGGDGLEGSPGSYSHLPPPTRPHGGIAGAAGC